MFKARVTSAGKVFCQESKAVLGDLKQGVPAVMNSADRIHLEIELPNFHCNVGGIDPTTGQQACLVCPRNLDNFQPESDELDLICRSIQPLMEKVSVLRFGGVAEPFWQGKIFELMSLLEISLDSDLKIFTTTSGTVLDESASERWFATVPRSEIAFSLDATCLETYLKLRRIAEYQTVIGHVDHYCRTRNPDHHVAVLTNNINLINIDEIEQMVELTKQHFFHYLCLSLTTPMGKRLKPICLNANNYHRFRQARIAAQAKASEMGVNVVFSGNWPE